MLLFMIFSPEVYVYHHDDPYVAVAHIFFPTYENDVYSFCNFLVVYTQWIWSIMLYNISGLWILLAEQHSKSTDIQSNSTFHCLSVFAQFLKYFLLGTVSQNAVLMWETENAARSGAMESMKRINQISQPIRSVCGRSLSGSALH